MNVNIDVNAAARRIQALIKASGGTAKYSQVLEEVAQMCGFRNYRAAEAARKAADAAPLKFSRTVSDWCFDEHEHLPADNRPRFSERQLRKFDIDIEQTSSSQFAVRVSPAGVDRRKLDGTDMLDVLIEVNDGLPCVHLTNDPYDAMLCSVFATREGLFVRKDGGDWAGSSQAEGYLREVVEQNEDKHDRGFIVALDTAAKYADN